MAGRRIGVHARQMQAQQFPCRGGREVVYADFHLPSIAQGGWAAGFALNQFPAGFAKRRSCAISYKGIDKIYLIDEDQPWLS
jgi:hypothetical protein